MDTETKQALQMLNDQINDLIDKLIIKRDNCKLCHIRDYRYIIKKMEHAQGMVHKAQENVTYKEVEFKL